MVGHFLAHAAERRINIAGALQSSPNMRQDVLASDMVQKIGPVEQLRRLFAAPQSSSVRPDFRNRFANTSSAWRPVASIAVILRSRTITTAGNLLRSVVASASFSVVPNRKGP